MKRSFDVFNHQWKTREPLVLSPEMQDLAILWCPWKAYARDLIAVGWKLEIVTNNATKKQLLYVRDPVSRQMGRAGWNGDAKFIHLDFFIQEHNKRISPPKIRIENDKVIGIDEEDIPLILEEISRIQKLKLKKKPKPKAEVIEMVKRRLA